MRISKAPEERKQEIIDTAMRLFGEKGYEATTMTDIAKEMNVVSGLCYRYFKSKEDLYHTALELYAKQCSAPIVEVLSKDYDTLEEYLKDMHGLFLSTDGKGKYHDFFHGKGNEMFHKQLEYSMMKIIVPHMEELLRRMTDKGILHVEDPKYMAMFFLYGQMPIINDETIEVKERLRIISTFTSKLIY